MAVIIPIAIAFAQGAAAISTIAAATTTLGLVAGYASLAGAVLTGVGALTGKKDLMKVGGILSLAGGIGGIADSMTNQAAGQAANAAADEAFKEAGDAALDEAFAGAAEGAAADMAAANGATQAAQDAAGSQLATEAVKPASASLTPIAEQAVQTTGATTGAAAGVQEAAQRAGTTLADVSSINGLEMAAPTAAGSGSLAGTLNEGLGQLGDTLGKGWDAAKEGLKGTGTFMKNNKELVNLAGGALDGAFGADARMVKLKERQLEMEKSLMDRAYSNLNTATPIHSSRITQLRMKGG